MKVTKKFLELNKDYYRFIEDYDWIEVTDKLQGLESFFHKLRERKVRKIVNKYKRGEKILDAGCGTGLILRHLPKGSIGIDINPRNVKRAIKHAPLAKIIEADIEKTPFSKNQFSTIICTEVLEHLPDPSFALRELKRILKRDGVIIGSVPSKSPIWILRFLSSTCPRGEPYHKNYKKEELVDLFADFKLSYLKRSNFGMSYFFVLEKTR